MLLSSPGGGNEISQTCWEGTRCLRSPPRSLVVRVLPSWSARAPRREVERQDISLLPNENHVGHAGLQLLLLSYLIPV